MRAPPRRALPLGQLASAGAAVLFACIAMGCASAKSEWKDAGYYVTDELLFGCVSFEGRKGMAMKRTAVPSLTLQRRLFAVLERASSEDSRLRGRLDDYRDQLMCWYETPQKDLELSLGELCDGPLSIQFHPHDGEWALISAEPELVLCHPIRSRR